MKKMALFGFVLLASLNLPAQFTDEPVSLLTKTGELKGTLLIPGGTKKFNLVILHPGSGPTDRNGNNPFGVKAKSYRLLAEALANKKIATLLIDKRGIGGSAAALKSEAELVFDDYVTDLVDWANLLKKDKRVKKLIIAGHSEGSLIGMLASQKLKAVDKYISLSGVAQSIDQVIVWQLQQQSSKMASMADSMFTRMKQGLKLDSVPPALAMLFRPAMQPYMASWIKHDPCAEIKKLTVPVLLIQGSTDIQVREEEGHKLHACNPAASIAVINEMSHVLKKGPADRTKNMATYSDEKLPIMPELVDEIVKFVK
ncbi:MAG: alpha/beta fold hydrolase [Ferruginibacter sp.]